MTPKRTKAKYTHLEESPISGRLSYTLCGRRVHFLRLQSPDEATCPRCLVELLIHTLPRPASD